LKQLPIYTEEEEISNMYSTLNLKGGRKVKKSVPKKKQIDTYKKDKLVKIAKKHGIKLSSKGVKFTKIQLFNSLKRKKLI
jgi:cell division protein FtsL